MTISGRPDHRPRVVVTGAGAVSGFGWGVEALRRGLAAGRTSIRRTRGFDARGHRTELAAEVPQPPPEMADRFRCWRSASAADRFALAAGMEAWTQAGVRCPAHRVGVFFATSTAGMAEAEEVLREMFAGRPGRRPLHGVATQQLHGPGNALAREIGARGPVWTISSACSAGAVAIGEALAHLRASDVDAAVAGGADSLAQLTYGGFNSLRAVDAEPCRPFRTTRAGLSLGEGSGVLVLERLTSALERGARPVAEVLGFATTCDAHHMTAPEPGGRGAAEAIEGALADAGLAPSVVSFVNAHGTGTGLNDEAEARALRRALGDAARPPVTAPKASFGHLLGAAGALEAVSVVVALQEGRLEPTPGEEPVDPAMGVDLVTGRARELDPSAVGLSVSLAFGGSNAALLFAAVEG